MTLTNRLTLHFASVMPNDSRARELTISQVSLEFKL